MKTIEEKAKAYDEALEDMRVIYPNLKGEVKLAVEHAFPQLCESEDKRIRKGLIHHLKELREWKVGTMSPIKAKEHYDVWIAYLEKQEQKPAWSEEDDWKRKELIQYLEEKGDYRTVWMTWLKSLRPKPKQEWSEEDERMLTQVFESIRYADDHYEFDGKEVSSTDVKAWLLKSLRPSWKPSEEQIAELKALANGKAVFTKDFIVKLYNDLLKLK